MSHLVETTADDFYAEVSPGIGKRSAVLAYGIFAYCIGVVGLGWLMLAVGGLAPVGLSGMEADSIAAALLVNLGLVAMFGVQHSVMARQAFKDRIIRYIPDAMERPTYMLMSGLVIMCALFFWQPLPGILWSVENTYGQIMLWAAFAAGWSYLLASTFITNHFELMGLRQPYLYFKNRPYNSLPFTRKYMYSYSRHPMMLGLLVGMWCVPVMSVTQFVIASLMSTYVFIGIFFEERDMTREFGKIYRQYKNDIATFIPRLY